MLLADDVLRALLDRAEGAAVRQSARAVQESFTGRQHEYWSNTLDQRDVFHERMRAAAVRGAVALTWAKQGGEDRPLERVRVTDRLALACFLGLDSLEGKVARSREVLAAWAGRRRVEEILEAWAGRKLPRGLGPKAAPDLADALRVIDATASDLGADHVARNLSVRLFGDSKRLEALVTALDLLTAESVSALARHREEVFSALGIVKEPQPFLVSGTGHLRLESGELCPVVLPFVGVASQAVTGYAGEPAWILTIENLTTFHLASRQLAGRAALIIFTGGMPAPSWVAAYRRILDEVPDDVPLYHWGDIDQGGFRIAARIRATCAGNRIFEPWLMDARFVEADSRHVANATARNVMARAAAAAGWTDIAQELAPETIEQEGIEVTLPPI